MWTDVSTPVIDGNQGIQERKLKMWYHMIMEKRERKYLTYFDQMVFLTKVDLHLSCSCPCLWAFGLQPGIVLYIGYFMTHVAMVFGAASWSDRSINTSHPRCWRPCNGCSIIPLRFGGFGTFRQLIYVCHHSHTWPCSNKWLATLLSSGRSKLEALQGIADSKTQEFRMMFFSVAVLASRNSRWKPWKPSEHVWEALGKGPS